MSRELPSEIINLLKDLIKEISGFEEPTQPFNHILRRFTVKLEKSTAPHFVNKRDIDGNITSMCEKFSFHNLARQASALSLAYHTYVPDSLAVSEKMNRLSMVKFLLSMSQAPTKYFLEHPEVLVQDSEQTEEVIDWGAYLMEGIEEWNPTFEESSDADSDASVPDDDCEALLVSTTKHSNLVVLPQIKSTEKICVMNLERSREELLATIQHTWYVSDECVMKPDSEHREANIGILWEKCVRESVHDLISLKEPSILSEYIVIREVLWQLQVPHNSNTFELVHNCIRVRPDVTLASVRSCAFYRFMSTFIPYIDLLEFFRKFERLVESDLSLNESIISNSYRAYCTGLRKILKPVYQKICDLEDKVRRQDCTYTLLNLANDLSIIFEPVKILKEIHQEVIIDPYVYSTLTCSLTLITKLHESLNLAVDKQEQDLKVTLFLHSMYPCLFTTDSWLANNGLTDYSNEFPIKKRVPCDRKNIEFEVDESCKTDTLLSIFFEKVVEIGRNVVFLRLLGKHNLIHTYEDSIYTEFIQKVLEKLHAWNGTNLPQESSKEENEIDSDVVAIENLTIFEPSNTNPNLNKLENMVDVTDGFLMAAFENFFAPKPPPKKIEPQETLYNKISNATTTHHLFPKTNFFEPILVGVIERRYSNTGLLVKDVLLNEYFLEKQFTFLKHLYLFDDDLIFPLYKGIFNQANSSNNYRPNNVWLTLQLHDIFTDIYPNFYAKTSVQVQSSQFFVDSLRACDLITINYDVSWPLTVIISPTDLEQYSKAFQFILKIKWALHTLNNLRFSELGLDCGIKPFIKIPSFKNKAVGRLARLKFCLLNLLNSLQHFLFGSTFAKISLEFEGDLCQARDLNSLIEIHRKFMKSLAEIVDDLHGKMCGKDESNNVLNCVKLLKMMWGDFQLARFETIDCCFKMYEMFLKEVSPIIFPLKH